VPTGSEETPCLFVVTVKSVCNLFNCMYYIKKFELYFGNYFMWLMNKMSCIMSMESVFHNHFLNFYNLTH
jgi:hypothetical protein